MRRIAAFVLVAAFGGAAASGQTRAVVDDYVKAQRKGGEAIKAKKYDDGIAAFKKSLELVPNDAVSAYNLACVHSLKSEADPALEWLGKSIDWGFGELGGDDLAAIETKDDDLVNVRKDARFAALVEKVKARRKAAADFSAKPESYVPAKLKDAPSVGLFVVLHDAGQSKTTALEKGPWKKIADELGMAVVVPSAPCMVGSDPAAGMRWFHFWFEFAERPFVFEKNVSAAVDLFKKEHKVDPNRMFLVGEGQGGMVAFDVAIGAPGSWKGVVVFASTLLDNGATAARAKTAGRASLPVRVLVPDSQIHAPNFDAKEVAAEFTAIEKRFKEWDLPGHLVRFQRDGDEPDQVATLIEAALKDFLPDEEPAGTKEGSGEKGDKDGGGRSKELR
jgi:predicted esterase